jgi:ribosome-binding ATPase YchF (GTP1/OBG family)
MKSAGLDLYVGVVGKPNVGKSSFLNVATNAKAEVGDRPFVTIEPNVGVSFFETACACAHFKRQEECRPRYGSCVNGVRNVPVKVLDVAGLVPGASQGLGLGNKFLDDLRVAHVLLHVVDASGTTNERGEKTVNYDPCNDAEWLKQEIEEWVFGNLWPRWGTVARRHGATKRPVVVTLQQQLGGYGARKALTAKVIAKMGLVDPVDLSAWDEEKVRAFVRAFLEERFRIVLVLNKIDRKESEKWISKLLDKYGDDNVVLCSAAAEHVLKSMVKKGLIEYKTGREEVVILKELDEKQEKQLQSIRDLILFRFGSTGVVTAINKAVENAQVIPVFPVNSIHNFGAREGDGCFKDVVIMREGSTFGDLAELMSGCEVDFIECGQTGQRVAEDAEVTRANNVVRFVFKGIDRKRYDADD